MKWACLRPCDTASYSHPCTSAPRSNVLFAQSATTHDLALQAALFTFRRAVRERGDQLPKCAKLVNRWTKHMAQERRAPRERKIYVQMRAEHLSIVCYSAARLVLHSRRGGGKPAFINNENNANFSVNTAGIVTHAQETYTGL